MNSKKEEIIVALQPQLTGRGASAYANNEAIFMDPEAKNKPQSSERPVITIPQAEKLVKEACLKNLI